MKLAEITQGWDAVERALDENQGELSPAIVASLDALNLAEREKVDGYVLFIRSLEGDAEKYKKLEDELCAKRKAALARIEWLKARVREYMDWREIAELKGDVFRFKLVKAGKAPVEVLVAPEELPREWVTITTTPNKDVIRKYLEAESYEANDGAMVRLGEATQSLRIF